MPPLMLPKEKIALPDLFNEIILDDEKASPDLALTYMALLFLSFFLIFLDLDGLAFS